jgi:hypothetical protein
LSVLSKASGALDTAKLADLSVTALKH